MRPIVRIIPAKRPVAGLRWKLPLCAGVLAGVVIAAASVWATWGLVAALPFILVAFGLVPALLALVAHARGDRR
jgi:hypothetical protein